MASATLCADILEVLMPQWLLLTLLCSVFLVLVFFLLKPLLRRMAADLEAQAEARAAANVAGTLLVAWLTPGPSRIRQAEIGTNEGIVFDIDTETASVETMQHLLAIAMAGCAGEAYAFHGEFRNEAADRERATAQKRADALVTAGQADLPWITLVMDDDGEPLESADPGSDPKTGAMMDASFLHALSLIAEHAPTFDRLRALLQERKILDEQGIERILCVMIPHSR